MQIHVFCSMPSVLLSPLLLLPSCRKSSCKIFVSFFLEELLIIARKLNKKNVKEYTKNDQTIFDAILFAKFICSFSMVIRVAKRLNTLSKESRYESEKKWKRKYKDYNLDAGFFFYFSKFFFRFQVFPVWCNAQQKKLIELKCISFKATNRFKPSSTELKHDLCGQVQIVTKLIFLGNSTKAAAHFQSISAIFPVGVTFCFLFHSISLLFVSIRCLSLQFFLSSI